METNTTDPFRKHGLSGPQKGVLVAVITIVLVVGIVAVTSPILSRTSVLPRNWHDIQSYYGRAEERTPTFSTTGAQFRIQWRYFSMGLNAQSAFFDISVYSDATDVSADYTSHGYLPQNGPTGPGGTGATIDVSNGPGSFYMKVYAANLDEWNVTVQDYY